MEDNARKKRVGNAIQNILLVAALWACQKSLRSLHALGQSVSGIIFEALVFGIVFALVRHFSPQPRKS